MDTLLQVGLSNAVVATGLAALAALVGRVWRRPALAHCLWLLVLAKLLTPPLVSVPLPWPQTPAAEVAAAPPTPLAEPDLALGFEEGEVALAVEPPGEAAVPTAVPEVPAPEPAAPAVAAVAWPDLLVAAWAAGSAGWLGLAAYRTRRFQRALRCARPAPAWLQDQAAELAATLGLARCPGVWLLPGRLSPMLWAVGGPPRLYLPAELLDRLDAGQRAALLVHELAHLRRGDYLVRALEFAATGLFWWHPVVWWARHELREAEEQCCDAWVVWALPGTGRAYALALVETVDFLSEARPPLPATASGFGHVHDLRRRVTMIMRGAIPRTLTFGGVLVVLGIAALLPLVPTWAQDKQAQPLAEKPPRQEDRRRGEEPDRGRPEEKRRADEIDKARAELKEAEAEVEKARERLRDAEARLRKAQERASDGQPGREGPGRPGMTPGPGGPGVPGARFGPQGERPFPPMAGRAEELERRLESIFRELDDLRREIRRPLTPSTPGGERREERREEKREERRPQEPGTGPRGGQEPPPVPPRPPTPPAPPREPEKRP